jgi:hypothetical protein
MGALPSKNSAVPPPTATESGNGVIGDTRSGAASVSPFGKDPEPSPPIREDDARLATPVGVP